MEQHQHIPVKECYVRAVSQDSVGYRLIAMTLSGSFSSAFQQRSKRTDDLSSVGDGSSTLSGSGSESESELSPRLLVSGLYLSNFRFLLALSDESVPPRRRFELPVVVEICLFVDFGFAPLVFLRIASEGGQTSDC